MLTGEKLTLRTGASLLIKLKTSKLNALNINRYGLADNQAIKMVINKSEKNSAYPQQID